MSITIELPEDVAERLERIPERERNTFAVAALRKELPPISEAPSQITDPVAHVRDHLTRLQQGDNTRLYPNISTRELFAQWAEEDARMTDEEREENDRIYAEIERNGIPRMRIER